MKDPEDWTVFMNFAFPLTHTVVMIVGRVHRKDGRGPPPGKHFKTGDREKFSRRSVPLSVIPSRCAP